MSGDGTVGSLGLNGAVGGLEDGGHETEGAVSLGNDVGLDITIVVLASPDEATAGFDHVGDHVVDKTVLVPETSSLELCLVGGLVDLLEDVLEATIVLLEDGVLGGQVARVVAGEGVLHARVGEAVDGIVSVVHAEHDTGTLEVEDLEVSGLRAILRGESHIELTWNLGAEVSGSVLIAKSVSTNDNWSLPAWNEFRDVANDDGCSEDSTADNVSDGSVRRLPHLFEAELLNTGLIRSDSGALDTNLAGLDCLSSLNGNLIVGGVTILHAEIEVLDIQVQVREDKLILDQLPDNSGHLITVHLDDGIGYLDLLSCGSFDHLVFV